MRDDEHEEHYYKHHDRCGFRLFWPLLIGIILIFLGISAILGIDISRYFWPIVAIVIGLLIIFGAVFSRRGRC